MSRNQLVFKVNVDMLSNRMLAFSFIFRVVPDGQCSARKIYNICKVETSKQWGQNAGSIHGQTDPSTTANDEIQTRVPEAKKEWD